MALRLGSLYVSLSADAGAFVKGFQNASAAAEKATKEIKRVAGEVAQVSAIFAGVAGAAVKLASSVDGPTKKAMDGLEKSTKLLAVQVADLLLPAVRQVTEMFRTAAGFVAGLSPPMRQAASTAAVLAVQLAVAGKALSVVAGGASSVFSIMKGLASAIGAVGVGPILAVAATVALVAGAVLLVHRAWRKNWGGIQQVTGEVLEWFRDAFGKFANFMKGVWDFLVDGAKAFVDGLLAVGDVLERVTGKNLGVGGLREGFAGLWKDLKSGSFFSEAFKFGKSVGEQIADGISEEWAELKKSLNFGGASGKTIGLGRGMGGAAGPLRSGALDMRAGAATVDTRAFLSAAQADAARSIHVGKMSTAGGTGTAQAQARDAANQRSAAIANAVGASSWGDAQKALSEGMKGAETFGDTLKVWGQRMGPMLAQSGQQLLGAVGDLVNSVVQGAQQGGVWGAIIAAFMEIAKKTASAMAFLDVAMEFIEQLAAMVEPLVAPIFDALTNVLAIVIDIVEPVFKALEPLFASFGQLIKNLAPILYAIGDVLAAISPILEFLGRVIGVIFNALKPVFELISGVIKVIASVLLGIIIAANEIAAFFGDQAAKAESQRLQGVLSAMWSRTAEMDMAASDAAAADLRKAAATDKATDSVRKFTESFANLPAGYRVQMARYDADLGMGSSWAGAGGGGNTTIITGPLTITTNGTPEDGEALAEEIEASNRRQRGQKVGNPTANNKTGRDPYR